MRKDVEALRKKVEAGGVTFQYLHLDSRTLARYLKAHGTVDDAYQKMVATEEWRKDFKVASISATTPGVRRMSASNLAQVVDGRDKLGRPVVVVTARNHSLFGRDMNDMTQYIIHVLELICSRCGNEGEDDIPDNMCLVFEMLGFGLSCMDYPALRKLYTLMTDHYPERLGVCLILNAPLIFSGCWPIIRSWLDENTASKIKFVKTDSIKEYLDTSILPHDM
ncbi:hypothetical protein O3P69_012123 [Scylla paramamosain]|uniref:CRAL-TRIO domain-containing protein n=1 Tax=Scylla paramamosain TaxID=85552 RepID=A0AAW0TC32_SCYPA